MSSAPPKTPPGRFRRRLARAARMVAALALIGGIYAGFTPNLAAEDQPRQLSAAAQEGKKLYDTTCISCHSSNLQGVQGRGPSLIGVGPAAVEFQVSSGRMPMARQEAQAERKRPMFTNDQARQLAAYVAEMAGGPGIPADITDDKTVEGDLAKGGTLFRINCASCHAFSGAGGALSSGKFAPPLKDSTNRQLYAAMLTGPQNMPVFGDNQLTPQEKKDIIAFVQHQKADQDPGGWGLGQFGPATEALAIFLVGIVALVFAALWIAGKS